MSASPREAEGEQPSTRTRKAVNAEAVLEAVNPPTARRLLVTLCFPLFILACLPWWWCTTSIVRLPLPKERIEALENARTPDIRSTIWLTADEDVFMIPPPGKVVYSTDYKLKHVAQEVMTGVDKMLARQRPAVRGERRWDIVTDNPKAPLRAHLHYDPTANVTLPLEPYIAASADGPLPKGTLMIPIHPDHVNNRDLKLHTKIALVNGIHWLLPEHIPEITNRALAYSPNITLSFVVLNEDSGDGSFVGGWDIDEAIKDHILPHLEPLAPVFNFSIESQVLYHAPLTFEPTQRDGQWRVDDDQLKIFISERWSLDSASTNNPVLKFLLFVPKGGHRPMYIGDNEATAFLVPQAASVILVNPPPTAEDGEGPAAHHLAAAALAAPFEQFVAHLYALLALPPLSAKVRSDHSAGRGSRGLVDPFSPYQLDTVLRQRLAENAAEARTTLAGIVRLVDKIKEMKVEDGVRDKVLGVVRRLEGLPAAAKAKSPLPAFILSRDAIALANEAFFDPSMMGLLYFPDEHKFAVYTPLFAPLGISMTLALLRELVAWKKRRAKRAAAAKSAVEDKAVKEVAEDEAAPPPVVRSEVESSAVSTAVEI